MLFLPQICKGTPQHEEICLGLFTLVLTEPAQAQKVRHARARREFLPEGFFALQAAGDLERCFWGGFWSRADTSRRLAAVLSAEPCLL